MISTVTLCHAMCQKCPRYNYTLYAIYGNADLGVQDPGREGQDGCTDVV